MTARAVTDLHFERDGAQYFRAAINNEVCIAIEVALAELPVDKAGVRIGSAPALREMLSGRSQDKLDAAAAEGAATLIAAAPTVDILVNNLGMTRPSRSSRSRTPNGTASSMSMSSAASGWRGINSPAYWPRTGAG